MTRSRQLQKRNTGKRILRSFVVGDEPRFKTYTAAITELIETLERTPPKRYTLFPSSQTQPFISIFHYPQITNQVLLQPPTTDTHRPTKFVLVAVFGLAQP